MNGLQPFCLLSQFSACRYDDDHINGFVGMVVLIGNDAYGFRCVETA